MLPYYPQTLDLSGDFRGERSSLVVSDEEKRKVYDVATRLPNHPSVVHVKEYKDPKVLTDKLKMLHRYKDKYLEFLQHKPSYNDNYFTLVSIL